ncbi:MAG: nucleotidyltransferase domain-containing protein [Ignavibacteriae bacterium]|nr:nucleotidyltransferase domain-containing protein [Ignavibacteriota bacterium]
MIVNNVLNKLFSAPTSIMVLRELSLRNTGITGRELGRVINITPQAVHNTLSNLETLKIVKREFAGRSHFFTLNRNHFLTKKIIESIFEYEREYLKSIFDKIKKEIGKETSSIILYGSVARKDENWESDFDICIVYNNEKKQIEDKIKNLRTKLYDDYGITLAPYYVSQKEFIEGNKKNKSPIKNIINEGKVISGLSISRLING